MKNKKGFSLVELLIVIAIIGVLAGIIVPSVVRYLKSGKEEYNAKLDTELVTVAKSYYSENKGKLPRGNLDNNGLRITKALISASYLVNNNYMTGEFKDSEGNDCSNTSYVIVEKEGNDYKYTSCIICNNTGYKNNDSENNRCNYKAPSADGTIKDNIPPRCELTYKSGTVNNWTNQNVYLTLTAEDNDGLAYYYINQDTDGTGKLFKDNPSYWTVEIEIKDNIFTDSYYAIVEDTSTGKIQCTFDGSIKIDKIKPEITNFAVESNKISSDLKTATVTINATDIGSVASGVDKVCVTTSNNSNTCDWYDISGENYINNNYTVPINDENTTEIILYAFVKDKAGNVSDSSSVTYKIYEYCTETVLKTSTSWSACSVSCGKGTHSKTEYYVDKYYPDVSCGDSKVVEDCNGNTCYSCYGGNLTTSVFSKSGYQSYLYGSESFQIMEYTTSCPVSNWKGCYIIKSSVNLKSSKRNVYFDGAYGYSGTYYGYIYPTCVNISGGTCACNPGSAAVSSSYSSAVKGTCYSSWSAWSSFAFGYTSRQSSTTLKQWSCVQVGSNTVEYKCRYRTRTSYSC